MVKSASNRVIINTLVQYVKTIVSVLLALYSTRLILEVLGAEDYGIYSLVGGVVAMLSFITNALITTTQRFMSFYYGKNDTDSLKLLFNNSLILHICLGLIVTAVLFLAGLFLFDGYLTIPIERLSAATYVYHIVVLTILLTFLTAPFKALLVSHENIVYISVIDMIDAVLKVVIAFCLSNITYDKLISYAIFLGGISLFNFFAFAFYAFKKYDECSMPRLSRFKLSYVKELFSFAWWNIYSTGCVVGRTQGIALIINRFYGPILNAAYGVAFSVSSAIQFVSSSLCNAMNPQIMKAEGASNRSLMLRLSEIESKFGFLLITLVGIPSIFEMETIMTLWLKTYPKYAVYFSQMVLLSAMIDQLTVGLIAANQAIGRIRSYSLVINTIKLITLPSAIICQYLGLGIQSIMFSYCIFELICALSRLPFLRHTAGLSICSFLKNVFFKEVIPLLISIIICLIVRRIIDGPILRLLLTFSLSIILSSFSIFLFSLCPDEKEILYRIINRVKKHG